MNAHGLSHDRLLSISGDLATAALAGYASNAEVATTATRMQGLVAVLDTHGATEVDAEEDVDDALGDVGELEADADRQIGATSRVLLGMVADGQADAGDYRDRIFPEGASAVTHFSGRPQAAAYSALRARIVKQAAEPGAALVRTRVDAAVTAMHAYESAITSKDEDQSRVTEVTDVKATARDELKVLLRLLGTHMASACKGEETEAWRSWARPYTEMRAALKAQATKRTKKP